MLLLPRSSVGFSIFSPSLGTSGKTSPRYGSVSQQSRSVVVPTATRVLSTAAAVNGDASSPSATNSESASSKTPQIRLNVYEKARTVTSVCSSGTLCTTSVHPGIEGAPFGSFVDYVLDDKGNPVLLMNDMSMHTINIQQASQEDGTPALVTLFVQTGGTMGATATSSRGQDIARCSITGRLHQIEQTADDMDTIRMRYSLKHAYADQVMDSPKFSFYRLVPDKIYYVGGFGVLAKWVEPHDYAMAAPDILAQEADTMIQKLNTREHANDLVWTATHVLSVTDSIEQVVVTNVDRLGMDVRVTSQKGTRRNKLQTDEFRIGFRIPVVSVEDAKSEVLKIFQESWEKEHGYAWDEEDPASSIPIEKIAADSLE